MVVPTSSRLAVLVAALIGASVASCRPPQAAEPDPAAACANEASDACVQWSSERLERAPLPEQRRAAFGRLYRACRLNHHGACFHLGTLYEARSLPAPPARRVAALFEHVCGSRAPVAPSMCMAAAFYARVCDAGGANGCVALASLWDSGRLGKRDGARAASLLRRACEAGDAATCVSEGRRFLSGEGVPRDRTRAAGLFSSGCDAEQGYGPSCHALGELYRRGFGVEADLAVARRYQQRACGEGDGDGCAALGHLAQHGRGGARDVALARASYERGCDFVSGLACERLGRMVEKGIGGDPDPAAAFGHYQRAAEIYATTCDTDPNGCVAYARLQEEGSGVEGDESAARETLKTHCGLGFAPACVAWMSRGEELVLSSDEAFVLDPLLAGCRANDADACLLLGRIGPEPVEYLGREPLEKPLELGCRAGSGAACNAAALRGTLPPDAAGQGWLERGCALGDPTACYHLGLFDQVGHQGEASEDARKYYERACNWHHGRACHRLGRLYRTGQGVAVDPARALAYYRRGCGYLGADACYDAALLEPSVQSGTGAASAEQRAELASQVDSACRVGSLDACLHAIRARFTDVAAASNPGPSLRGDFEALGLACKRQHDTSCIELGDAYAAGVVVKKSVPKALRSYARGSVVAADLCHATLDACHDGTLSGASFKRRWERSGGPALTVTWAPMCDADGERHCERAHGAMLKQCDLADGFACESAAELGGRLARVGLSRSNDIEAMQKRARAAFEKSCKDGSAGSCHRLATYQRDGIGARANARDAQQSQERACELDPDLCE